MGRFENYLLNEETMTEVVHEAFFALAMLAINGKEVNRYNNIETMDDLKAFVFGDDKSFSGFAKIMKGGGDIVKAIGKFVKDDVLDSKQLERKDDALVLAKIANKILFIDNKKMKFVSASRVFSTGQKGLADAIIVTKSNVGKGRIFVSLKYDKGQANSLSTKELLNLVYGTDLSGDYALLKTIYNRPDGKKAMDNALEEFIKMINKESERINKGSESLEKWEPIDIVPIQTWIQWIENPKKKDIARRYTKKMQSTKSGVNKEYLRKKKIMNDVIDTFLSSNGIKQENSVEIVAKVFRMMSDDSYLYLAEKGSKVFFIPSIKLLKNYNVEIEVIDSGSNQNSFNKDIWVKINGKRLMKSNILLRWSDRQFMGDLSQKGTVLDIIDKNFRF
jgi:hypothetical protein